MTLVTIELWLWLGRELTGDFESLSEMRSKREEKVEEGTTIRELLCYLARRYYPIARDVFDLKEKKVYSHVIVNYNDRVINPHTVHDQILGDGDRITILPMYMGG
jgi:molybdopterin converting factor small subunit